MEKKSEIIGERYVLNKKLGAGGMSSVYLAWDIKLEKYWAIKSTEEKNIVSSMSESEVLKNLDHPSLPRIVDVINEDEKIYLVMDYVDGETLGEILRKRGNIDEESVRSWCVDILRGLDYLHRQNPPIIYRDMKPDNVMLSKEGNIKIIDFGIARMKKEDNIMANSMQDTVLLGTRGYAAPEQFGGVGQSDERTDVYCLGATMYHLITGKNPCEPPYHMYPIRHWDKSLSEGMERVIQRATRSDPDKRYQNCQEFLHALSHLEDDEDKEKRIVYSLSKVYKWLITCGIILVGLSFLLSIFSKKLTYGTYDKLLARSERAVAYEDKYKYIEKAIDTCPGNEDGYYRLINLIKDDGVFDQYEEALMIGIWERNSNSLSYADYGSMAYEVGILYWYYYSYGADNMFNIRQSVSWFQEAVSHGENQEYLQYANCYYLLGLFNRDIASKVMEGGDAGMYLEYFGNLERLIEIVDGDITSKVAIDSRKQVLLAIESYRLDFEEDGVDKHRIEELVNSCQEVLNDYGDYENN